jgi:two-component sensor histidine kinase
MAQAEAPKPDMAHDEIVEGLERSRHLLEHAEEMADIGSWEFDYLTGNVTASSGAYRIYGVPKGELTIESIESIPLPEFRPMLDRARDELINDGIPYDMEFRIERRSDGVFRDIHSKARWDPAKKRLFGIIRDITEEKEAAEGLKRALAEKETLIKELYHRTKNNMQVIISLMGIEVTRSADDPKVREVFNEVQRRIDAMALVHEMLCQSNDLSRIDLQQFIPTLVKLLISSLGDHEGRIAFVYDVERVDLLIDMAVPCGIILNELVTNALIHAFPGDRSGTISFKLRREDDGTIVIEVRDDGVGVPEPFDGGERNSSLGLSLVSSIGKFQLRGSVDFETGKGGFACILRFNDRLYEARVAMPKAPADSYKGLGI